MIVEIRNQKGRKWRVRRRGGYLPERLRVFSHGGWNRDSEIENHCQLKITADGVPGEKTLRQGTKPGGGKAGRRKFRGGGGERKREGAKRRDETPAWTEAERRRESRGGEAGNEPATEAQEGNNEGKKATRESRTLGSFPLAGGDTMGRGCVGQPAGIAAKEKPSKRKRAAHGTQRPASRKSG